MKKQNNKKNQNLPTLQNAIQCKKRFKRGQEEMLGFALIIIIVAIVLLVFLGLSLNKPQRAGAESYEVWSFISASLQFTSECEDASEYKSVQKLIFDCDKSKMCLNGKTACEMLNLTIIEIANESWLIEEDSPVKGYELEIVSDEKILFSLEKGNATSNYKGAVQDFSRSGKLIRISFNAYY